MQSFACPNCGAALPVEAGQTLARCAYCGVATAIVQAAPLAAFPPDPLVPDPSLSEVATLFRAGKRVQATIRYREITGAGLKEARLAIDRFAAGEPLRRPDLMSH